MAQHEQQLVDRDAPDEASVLARRLGQPGNLIERKPTPAAERAARDSLKAQISRLEHEISEVVSSRFPFIAAPTGAVQARARGPRLQNLEELERSRDRLAARAQELRWRAQERTEHERGAREQLERMKLEPGRYKFVRLPVSDLGQGGCGVWEVRPRLGLIGMLAGWWQVKLSSGCPLPKGSRSMRDPAPPK